MNENDDINFNELILGQLRIIKKYQEQLTELKTKEALGQITPQQAKSASIIPKAAIKEAEEAIAELNHSRKEINKVTTEESLEVSLAEEKEIISKLITQHNIGYLAEQNKFIYCMGMQEDSSEIVNPIFKVVEANRFGRVIAKMAKSNKATITKLSHRTHQDELIDYFQDTDNDYYDTTSSFHSSKWGKNKVYNKLSVIRKFWVQPNYAEQENYDLRFDFLMSCVGGGKVENIDHLEQWIAYKWMYPERIANTPNLDIGGSPGGNGKGRYGELCKTVFTNPCVIIAALKELLDGFNGTWDMATVLLYDEPAQNELPEGKLKQATGGEDMRHEKKGIDASIVDRNYNILFLSNNANGVVKLSGTGMGGEDRRYSVMITDKVMLDEAIDSGMNTEEASVFVNSINDLVKNRKEVAKWLAHIITKHKIKEMSVLRALHGEDYQQRFEDQKTNVDSAFDQILPVYLKNECIPSKILYEITLALTGNEKLTQNGCSKLWKRYCNKKKIEAISKKVRLRNLFNGVELFTQPGYSIFSINEFSNTFDHGDITDKKPTKHTVYSSSNISLSIDDVAGFESELFDESATPSAKMLHDLVKKHIKH